MGATQNKVAKIKTFGQQDLAKIFRSLNVMTWILDQVGSGKKQKTDNVADKHIL